jgi:hypothetical protein
MEIQDYLGRSIRLTEERIAHFLENHPELASESLSIIVETLQNPDEVIVSSSDETVELFYRYYIKTPVGDKWLCVLVKNLVTDFFIITAYFTNSQKKGKKIWKRI